MHVKTKLMILTLSSPVFSDPSTELSVVAVTSDLCTWTERMELFCYFAFKIKLHEERDKLKRYTGVSHIQ